MMTPESSLALAVAVPFVLTLLLFLGYEQGAPQVVGRIQREHDRFVPPVERQCRYRRARSIMRSSPRCSNFRISSARLAAENRVPSG